MYQWFNHNAFPDKSAEDSHVEPPAKNSKRLVDIVKPDEPQSSEVHNEAKKYQDGHIKCPSPPSVITLRTTFLVNEVRDKKAEYRQVKQDESQSFSCQTTLLLSRPYFNCVSRQLSEHCSRFFGLWLDTVTHWHSSAACSSLIEEISILWRFIVIHRKAAILLILFAIKRMTEERFILTSVSTWNWPLLFLTMPVVTRVDVCYRSAAIFFHHN